MLSYQHAYHAGNRADIQKHSLLCRVLEVLTRKERPLTYMETHAGRGVYDLFSAEAVKTGEAAEGWLALSEAERAALPTGYVEVIKKLNGGALSPLYPGSPILAAHMLRVQDKLRLMELHPQEYAALERRLESDERVQIHKRDGLEGVLALSPPTPRKGVVLIDPSYELKEEYETIPAFMEKLVKKWPEGCFLTWIPMLPAGRHEGMMGKLQKTFPALQVFKTEWEKQGQGLYGSIMAGINLPHGF
ncbi:MAG: 23S rRNA (adenine(2030)-N(6))-methyltransferase RlmJ [Alphaproteobacteria bacterium]